MWRKLEDVKTKFKMRDSENGRRGGSNSMKEGEDAAGEEQSFTKPLK